jgi:hypothetical protein
MALAGYVFGYGTLADPRDPLVERVGVGEPVSGHLEGFRRRWNVAMHNRAPLNDHEHYVDRRTRERLDIYPVALNIEVGDGRANGLAIPVDERWLPEFELRELHYDRIDVSSAFAPALDLPVWTFSANAQAKRDFATGIAEGRAFIRRGYHDRVIEIFRGLGPAAWFEFAASTDAPQCPLADLDHVTVSRPAWAGVAPDSGSGAAGGRSPDPPETGEQG